MKRILERIFGIALILILGYQQFCYADVVSINPIDEFRPIAFFIGFIAIVIFIITAISSLALKSTTKKENVSINENELEIEEKQDRMKNTMYICGTILSIVGLIYLFLSR